MKTTEMKRQKKKAVTVSFRCPEDVYIRIEQLITDQDSDFSKFCRRAIKNEVQRSAA